MNKAQANLYLKNNNCYFDWGGKSPYNKKSHVWELFGKHGFSMISKGPSEGPPVCPTSQAILFCSTNQGRSL